MVCKKIKVDNSLNSAWKIVLEWSLWKLGRWWWSRSNISGLVSWLTDGARWQDCRTNRPQTSPCCPPWARWTTYPCRGLRGKTVPLSISSDCKKFTHEVGFDFFWRSLLHFKPSREEDLSQLCKLRTVLTFSFNCKISKWAWSQVRRDFSCFWAEAQFRICSWISGAQVRSCHHTLTSWLLQHVVLETLQVCNSVSSTPSISD